jgi:hypothetical protein
VDCFGGGLCMPVEDGCTEDADCWEGWTCEMVYCAYDETGSADVPCLEGGVCVPPSGGCTSDADCADSNSLTFDYCIEGMACLGEGDVTTPYAAYCVYTVGENCWDASDNDADGLIDMDDPDCAYFPCIW